MNKAFHLEDRWNSRVDEVKISVETSVSEQRAQHQRKPWGTDYGQPELIDTLADVADKRHSLIGTQQNMILMESYIRFALTDHTELDELLNA